MHAFRGKDIDGPGKRCWRRGHKNSETTVLEFFNNECGHKGLFNFGQRRLPHVFLTTSRQLLGQTPKELRNLGFFQKEISRFAPVPLDLPGREQQHQ